MTASLAYFDYLASAGRGAWHRASAISKIALLAALVLAAVFTPSLAVLVGLFALAWVLALTARVPLRVAAVALSYPLLFSLLFAASHLDGTWRAPATLVLRALTTGLGAVWLVSTTPFPDLFAPASRVLPRVAGDGLFLTYRAFFALVTRAEYLWRALRLRGGLGGRRRPVVRASQVVGEGLGTLVLHSFERSQRLYGAMRLRGQSGRICGCRHYAEWTRYDVLPLGLAVVLAAAFWATRGWP